MRALIVGLLMSSAGLWALGRALASLRRGTTPRFFKGPGDALSFATTPFAFIANAGMWLACGALLAGVGGLLVAGIDPVVGIASPAGVAAAGGVALVLRRRGGRSGDAGAGALDALAEADRDAMVARVEALPEGGERAVLRRVLDAWPVPEPIERDYRQEPPRRVLPDPRVLERAVAAEQRALAVALLPAAAGVVPVIAFVVLGSSIRFIEAAMVTATVDTTIALGAVVVWRVASREHAAFAAAAREASLRAR